MDKLTQLYIDELAQATHKSLLLQAEVEKLQEENKKLQEDIDKIREENRPLVLDQPAEKTKEKSEAKEVKNV
ncbi:hypothetical protein HV819_02285 [Anaerococcus sp. AGMB00486]|uniref:Uncharacterized protein n=2 Tax=Anaerococcus TaxID=165779 RepID=A0ABX2N830_9FIRM|nr:MULTISPECIES: hypothetical protein [Anaerococcus]MSS77374.1 hypothetical protein [Anaerococcus porci]NVF10825.1 hypothetical protein [Anaerococcus faecalis]